jgi:hypothetical protein
MTDYDVRFIVWNSSVGSHFLVSYCGNLTLMTFFDLLWYMIIPVFVVYYYHYCYLGLQDILLFISLRGGVKESVYPSV